MERLKCVGGAWNFVMIRRLCGWKLGERFAEGACSQVI